MVIVGAIVMAIVAAIVPDFSLGVAWMARAGLAFARALEKQNWFA